MSEPASLRERFSALKAARDYAGMIDLIPYAKFLGLSIEQPEDPTASLVTSMAFAPHLVGNPRLPALHGGTLGALLESAAVFELLWRAETLVLPKTITLTVDYLRSAGPASTHARATITRSGRRVTNVTMEAWQADRTQPVVQAHAIFLVKRD